MRFRGYGQMIFYKATWVGNFLGRVNGKTQSDLIQDMDMIFRLRLFILIQSHFLPLLLLTQTLSKFDGNKLYIPISAAMHRDGFIAIEIKSINPVKTSDVIADSKDTRMLSIGLVSALSLKFFYN